VFCGFCAQKRNEDEDGRDPSSPSRAVQKSLGFSIFFFFARWGKKFKNGEDRRTNAAEERERGRERPTQTRARSRIRRRTK